MRSLINKSFVYSVVFNEHLFCAGKREQWRIRRTLAQEPAEEERLASCVSARKVTGALREGN